MYELDNFVQCKTCSLQHISSPHFSCVELCAPNPKATPTPIHTHLPVGLDPMDVHYRLCVCVRAWGGGGGGGGGGSRPPCPSNYTALHKRDSHNGCDVEAMQVHVERLAPYNYGITLICSTHPCNE